MIPILFEKTDTDFTTHGLCRLPDAIMGDVYTEGNGQFELTMEYPISGANYNEILIERIIGVYTDDSKKIQGFRVYAITKPLSGKVTIYARHVSYDLSGYPVTIPSGSYTPASLMALAFQGTPFTGWSDISTQKTVEHKIPISARSLLGGVEGSILDIWGGEYEFDNFTVKLHASRGADNGVSVEYGKNITNLVDQYNTEDVFNAVLPYAVTYDSNDNEKVVIGDKISFNSVLTTEKTAIIDFSDRFDIDETPTKAKLATLAQAYIQNNNPGNTVSNMSLSFVPLWYDGGDQVGLFDTITARHTKLGVDKKVRVVAINYDFLLERISKITCGKLSANFVSTVIDMQEKTTKQIERATQMPDRWQQAIIAATEKITGNVGGYVILHEGEDGKPYELLILDDPDINLARNVWRWNLAGLGFSSNGYQGPFTTAFTADGQINASMITTGALQVLDSLGRVLFSADSDSNSVQIAGFNVNRAGMRYTVTEASSSGKGNRTYTMDLSRNGITNTLDDWLTVDKDGNPVPAYRYVTTSHIDEGVFEVTDGYGNYAGLLSDRIRFRNEGGRLLSLGPMYEIYHYESSTAAKTYTKTVPNGVYLVIHCKQTTPYQASTGLSLLVIGSADPGAASIMKIGGGSEIGASTSESKYSTVTATCNGDLTGTVTWKIKGEGYRKLILLRLN